MRADDFQAGVTYRLRFRNRSAAAGSPVGEAIRTVLAAETIENAGLIDSAVNRDIIRRREKMLRVRNEAAKYGCDPVDSSHNGAQQPPASVQAMRLP